MILRLQDGESFFATAELHAATVPLMADN